MMGVETQTQTVWKQANKFKIPRLGFINKLDRPGSSKDLTLTSIKKKLKMEPLLITTPIKEENLTDMVDLTTLQLYSY